MSLESATRDELLQLIMELQEALARAEARIGELETERGRGSGPPKTPENSSSPPAKGYKRNKAQREAGPGRKQGPPVGHEGTSRRRGSPDLLIACHPERCHACGQALDAAPQRRVGVSQVVELPPVQPVVLEAWRYEATCPACGAVTRADYPAGLEPHRVFGPSIEALLTYCHEVQHVSYERLEALCGDLFGLHLSPGAIAHALARTAQRLEGQAERIAEQVRASPVIGSDETSARVHGANWWQWVFQTPEASFHIITPSRGGAVVREFLGQVQPPVWVSDLWKPQLGAAATTHQICLAHQLRDLQYVVDAERSPWARQFQALLRGAIHLAHARDAGELAGTAYPQAVQGILDAADALLAEPARGAEANRMWERFRSHRNQLFVFLARPDVPPTNNASERALRPSVVHRKIGGSFRSNWGPAAHATVATILGTAQKRGEGLLSALYAATGLPLLRESFFELTPAQGE
jgi:transposase